MDELQLGDALVREGYRLSCQCRVLEPIPEFPFVECFVYRMVCVEGVAGPDLFVKRMLLPLGAGLTRVQVDDGEVAAEIKSISYERGKIVVTMSPIYWQWPTEPTVYATDLLLYAEGVRGRFTRGWEPAPITGALPLSPAPTA